MPEDRFKAIPMMVTMADETGTTIRTYDALNRNISKDVPTIGKSVYEYDLAATAGEYSERTTDPKGNVILKTYDKVGRLSKVTADGKTTQYGYYNVKCKVKFLIAWVNSCLMILVLHRMWYGCLG